VLAMKLLKAPPHELTALQRLTCIYASWSTTVPIVEMSMIELSTESGWQNALGGAGVGTEGSGKHAALDSKTNVVALLPVELRVTPFGAASSATPHCRYTVHTTAVTSTCRL
jgi:hypothetical protein